MVCAQTPAGEAQRAPRGYEIPDGGVWVTSGLSMFRAAAMDVAAQMEGVKLARGWTRTILCLAVIQDGAAETAA